MMVPAFMVPDNRVSLYVEDPAANEKSASKFVWRTISVLGQDDP
jgi:hypothetical protein